MLIRDPYNISLYNAKSYTNEEYLALQIWQLQHVYCSEAAAIKNTKLQFVAFTDQFYDSLGFNESMLGKTLTETSILSNEICQNIEQQEQMLLDTKRPLDTMVNFVYNNQRISNIVRAKALVNPTNDEVVGVMSFEIKYAVFLDVRRIFSKIFKPNIEFSSTKIDIDLSETQQQIITCLLLGFHNRKEIAFMLKDITSKHFTELQVKRAIQKLYGKFNCSNANELVDLIVNTNAKSLFVPPEFSMSNISVPLDEQ